MPAPGENWYEPPEIRRIPPGISDQPAFLDGHIPCDTRSVPGPDPIRLLNSEWAAIYDTEIGSRPRSIQATSVVLRVAIKGIARFAPTGSLATRLQELIGRCGPDSIGVLGSARATNELARDAGLAQSSAPSMQTTA
jgi:hypothetical protein